MPQFSAGILLYRRRGRGGRIVEVFLVHPGGPYWARKDDGAWSIPKGLIDPDEDALLAAQREFREETGFNVDGEFVELGTFKLLGGKRLQVWALEGDCDPAQLTSNTFEMIWPPQSGRLQSYPEVDRGAWFDRETALVKATKGQKPVLESFFLNYKADR